MRIDANQAANALRLVRATDATPQPAPTRPTTATSATAPTRSGDTYDFESVYRANLPRIPLTEARRRLEQLRSQLVAARTEVPIHFNDTLRSPAANNPYTPFYLQSPQTGPADYADRNDAATENA